MELNWLKICCTSVCLPVKLFVLIKMLLLEYMYAMRGDFSFVNSDTQDARKVYIDILMINLHLM